MYMSVLESGSPLASSPPANVSPPHTVLRSSTSDFHIHGCQINSSTCLLFIVFSVLGIHRAPRLLWAHCFLWTTEGESHCLPCPNFHQEGMAQHSPSSYCFSLAIALHPGVKIPSPLGIIVSCCLSNFLTFSLCWHPCLIQQPDDLFKIHKSEYAILCLKSPSHPQYTQTKIWNPSHDLQTFTLFEAPTQSHSLLLTSTLPPHSPHTTHGRHEIVCIHESRDRFCFLWWWKSIVFSLWHVRSPESILDEWMTFWSLTHTNFDNSLHIW